MNRIPFQTGAKTGQEPRSDRQAQMEAEMKEWAIAAQTINQERSMRRSEPKIPARDKVIADIRQIERDIEALQVKANEARYLIWQTQEKTAEATEVATLAKLASQAAALIREQEQIAGQIMVKERQKNDLGALARNLLDAWDSLQYNRRQLIGQLAESTGEQKKDIENALQRILNRLKRFDNTEQPLYALAVSMHGGDL